MKPKEVKSFELFLREDRISSSNNGRTLATRVLQDKKKTYNRQKEKRNRLDSSYFVLIINFISIVIVRIPYIIYRMIYFIGLFVMTF
jgi:hypothetical protein